MNKGLSPIVKNVAAVALVPITVFGLYVIAHGHLTPGGGFPGGAIIATMTALLLISFGTSWVKAIGKERLSMAESLGLVGFVGLAIMGIGKSFFNNFLVGQGLFFGNAVAFGPNPGWLGTAGLIPLMNMAVGLEVFAAISLIAITMFTAEVSK